jgi:L-serine/L-threonine ammonia-lyase
MNLSNALHVRTPLIESPSLSEGWGKQVFLKMENMQPTGSFKLRGIGRLCQTKRDEGVKRFVSSSGGNAGYAAAYSGNKLGVSTTVFIPEGTRAVFRQQIEAQGAEVKEEGKLWNDTDEKAKRFRDTEGAFYVSPFNHRLIWEGHSTLVDEIVDEIGKPDAIVLSVGGGGLLCGVIEGLRRHALTDVPIVAVETTGTASLKASLDANKLEKFAITPGEATSLAAQEVAQQAFDWSVEYQVKSVVVTNEEAKEACIRFYDEYGYLVEPACGASLSVAYQRHRVLEKANRIVVIVCGGIGTDLKEIQTWRNDLGLA